MAYVLPQVKVFQDFQIAPAAANNPLNAFLVGGLADLIRFSREEERDRGDIGFYDSTLMVDYNYPSRSVGARVELDSVRLWAQDAILQYFSGSTVPTASFTTVAGSRNRITSDTVNFADNGIHTKHPELLDRGAAVGDVVKVQLFPENEEPQTLWSTIRGFAGDVIAPVVSPAFAHFRNQQTVNTTAATINKVGGSNASNPTVAADASAYDGFTDRAVTETYTVTVVIGDAAADDYSNARLRVTSSTGRDNQASIPVAGAGVATPVGTRGLTVTFSLEDLIAGQVFEVQVDQAFEEGAVTSDGTYTGEQAATYWVRVIRGARLPAAGAATSDEGTAVLRVFSNINDAVAAVNVTNRDTDIAVGSLGVTIQATTDLYEGDYFIVRVSPAAESNLRTLVLAHNIPEGIPAGTSVDLSLYLYRDALEISRIRPNSSGADNFTPSTASLNIEDGIEVFDSRWTSDGQLVSLPLQSSAENDYGRLFVEYRQWLSDKCGTVSAINDAGDLGEIPGPLDVENPLKWGLFKALQNSNGTTVYYSGVCDLSDADEWADALGLTQERDDIYSVVPLSNDPVVQNLFAAHATSQSAPERGRWRVTWVSVSGVSEVPVVHNGTAVQGHLESTSTDGNEVLASVVDSGTGNTEVFNRLLVPAANGGFDTNNVRPKDTLRINFREDAFGNEIYDEYQIDLVINEDELLLASPLEEETIIPLRIEIWRNLPRSEEANEIARRAGAWATRRVRAVWPDTLSGGGQTMPGYHLCAALAGLASGILPQQSMTNLEISGFDSVSRTVDRFTRDQLDIMAGSGTWIVTQSTRDNRIYSRQALTAGDSSNINTREESLTRNVDSISYRFRQLFEPFIGVSNITPQIIAQIRVRARSLINSLRASENQTDAGAQLIAAAIIDVRQHALFRDRVVVVIQLEVPYPLNNLEISLVV